MIGKTRHSNTQVSVFIEVWWLHAAIPCTCVKLKFQFTIRDNWKSSKWHASSYSVVFGSLQSLPCIFCTNQTKKTPLHLTVSSSEQKNISTLKYAFLIQIGLIILSFFFAVQTVYFKFKSLKQFNTSWRVEPGGKFQSLSMY